MEPRMPQEYWFSTRGGSGKLPAWLDSCRRGQSPGEGAPLSLFLEDGGQPFQGKTSGGSPQPDEEPVEKFKQSSNCASSRNGGLHIEVEQRGLCASKSSDSGGHTLLSTVARKLPAVPQTSRRQRWHSSQPLWPRWEPQVCAGGEADCPEPGGKQAGGVDPVLSHGQHRARPQQRPQPLETVC